MIIFLGGSSFSSFHEFFVFMWSFTTVEHGTSSNKLWFIEFMSVHCLKHFFQTDILDWLLHCKMMMWCQFWWCNIPDCYTIAACSDPFTFAVYWSNNTKTQPSFTWIWATTFTMYDFFGSSPLMQLAPIRRPTWTSSLCTVSFDIDLRCFHSLNIEGVAISSLSTCISLLVYNFGSDNKLSSQLVPDTFMPSTALVLSVFFPMQRLQV